MIDGRKLPIALAGAKAWRRAHRIWAESSPSTPLQNALALEAALGCGQLDHARRHGRALETFGAGHPWIDKQRAQLVEMSRIRDQSPPQASDGAFPRAVWHTRIYDYEGALDLLHGIMNDDPEDHKAAAWASDICFRVGEFEQARDIALRVLASDGTMPQSSREKLERICKYSDSRLAEPPEGSGLEYWAARHPIASLTNEIAALQGPAQQNSVTLLYNLVEHLQDIEPLVDAFNSITPYNTETCGILLGHSFLDIDLFKIALDRIKGRDPMENHWLSIALIKGERLDLVPAVFERRSQ